MPSPSPVLDVLFVEPTQNLGIVNAFVPEI
jgi:hypothetical protein